MSYSPRRLYHQFAGAVASWRTTGELPSTAARRESEILESNGSATTVVDGGHAALPSSLTARQPSRRQKLTSILCTERQFCTSVYSDWCQRISMPIILHRKVWEYYYICQALHERDMLRPGRRGLGFAVGQEPLPSVFAAMGCEIVASDLPLMDERAAAWANTNQHASTLEALNKLGLCEAEQFSRVVSFVNVDMNHIPDDLTGFDFTWSSCSFEHCGSLEAGMRFIDQQMKCLKPGGVAVHTTEYNVSSNEDTVTTGETVIYRRRDLEEMARRLTADGHHLEPFDFDQGCGPADRHVDESPYTGAIHLKLRLYGYVATSIGLIIRKGSK